MTLAAALLRVAALAPAGVDSPALASSFFEGSDVACRVRRLMNASGADARRSTLATAVCAVVVFAPLLIVPVLTDGLYHVHALIEVAVKTLP